jgi:hypothetical protein
MHGNLQNLTEVTLFQGHQYVPGPVADGLPAPIT